MSLHVIWTLGSSWPCAAGKCVTNFIGTANTCLLDVFNVYLYEIRELPAICSQMVDSCNGEVAACSL